MTEVAGFFTVLGIAVTILSSWLTHVIVTISYLTSGAADSVAYAVLLAIGVFVPPVGMIHGVGVWFGAW